MEERKGDRKETIIWKKGKEMEIKERRWKGNNNMEERKGDGKKGKEMERKQ